MLVAAADIFLDLAELAAGFAFAADVPECVAESVERREDLYVWRGRLEKRSSSSSESERLLAGLVEVAEEVFNDWRLLRVDPFRGWADSGAILSPDGLMAAGGVVGRGGRPAALRWTLT